MLKRWEPTDCPEEVLFDLENGHVLARGMKNHPQQKEQLEKETRSGRVQSLFEELRRWSSKGSNDRGPNCKILQILEWVLVFLQSSDKAANRGMLAIIVLEKLCSTEMIAKGTR